MSVVTLSSKFQVAIPKDIRDGLNLRPGQKLVFLQTGSAIKLVPQPAIDDLVGLARGARTHGVRDRDDRVVSRRAAKPAKSTAARRR